MILEALSCVMEFAMGSEKKFFQGSKVLALPIRMPAPRHDHHCDFIALFIAIDLRSPVITKSVIEFQVM